MFLDHCIGQHIDGQARHRHRLDGQILADRHCRAKIVDRCLQLFGGYGYMDEYPISRMYRDARVQRIYAGTNEIMKVLIAQEFVELAATQEKPPMTDAFIYDAVRTPRGRGKADGALHEVTALDLATPGARRDQGPQQARSDAGRRRGARLRRSGRRGGRRHRARRGAHGRLRRRGAGRADQPLLRLRARRGQFRRGRGHVRPARHDDRRRRRIDEPRRHRRLRRRLADGSVDRAQTYFMPQGISADLIATKYGFSRDDVDAYAVESQKRAAAAWEEGRFKNSVVAGEGRQRHHASWPRTSTCGRRPTCSRWRSCSRRSCRWASMGGFDAVAVQAHPEVEAVKHVHHAGNSSGIVDGAAAVLIGSKEAGARQRLKPRATHQGVRQYRLGAGDHADRADRRDQEGAQAAPG